MTNLDIAQQRLHNQLLGSQKLRKPEDVIRWMGAVQAQDYNGAVWSVGQRLQTATSKEIEKAFNSGRILRTHVMRPTWHFVLPEDIRWLLKLTASNVDARLANYYRKVGLSEAVFRRSNKVLERVLKGGNQLTRELLRNALQQAGISTAEYRFMFLLVRAELDGVICSGPRIGKQFTYALLEERAPQPTKLTHEQALAELSRRYFRSHGPATLQDFAWWSGLRAGDARKGVQLIKKEIVNEVIDGKMFWRTSKTTSRAETLAALAHLLPTYDEYVVAYKNRDAIFDSVVRRKGSGWTSFTASLVFEGEVIGSWKRSLEKNSVKITLRPYAPLSKRQERAIKKAVKCYGEFLGMPSEMITIH